MDKLMVIVPSFNEENTIAKTITNLQSIKDDLLQQNIKLEICIINDGSSDKTSEIAQANNADHIVNHHRNKGLGAAVRTGLTFAKKQHANIVVKFDADLQHEPKDILKLIKPIINDESDIVYGNRFANMTYKMPFVRKYGNKIFIKIMRWLTDWDLKDSQPGIFAVSKNYLQIFRLPGNYNYTQQVLLDGYHKDMRFSHVDVTFNKRTEGKSFVSLKYPFKVLPQLFMVLVGIAPMRIFVPIGSMFLFTGIGVFIWQLANFFLGNQPQPIQNVNLVLGAGTFGAQCIFFGVLAQLVIEAKKK